MSRIFTCGFEEQALAETMWTVNVTPTATTSAPTPHSGTYCLQCNTTSEYVQRGPGTAVTTGTYYTRVYIQVPAWPLSQMEIIGVGTQTGTWALAWSLSMNTDGTLFLFNETGSAAQDTSATVLAVDTWYRLEWEHAFVSSVGTVTLNMYLGDSTTILETLTLPSETIVATSYGRIRFGRSDNTTGTFTIYLDDIAWNVADGSGVQDSWCGPGKIVLLWPFGDITNTWEDELGATGTYTKIQKVPAATVADTAYLVEAAVLNSIDRLALSDMPLEVPSTATITLVDAYARVGGSQGSAAGMRLKLWNETGLAGLTDGPLINCNAASFRTITFAEHLVVSGAGKAKADINSWSVGYENITDAVARHRRVSALWVNVEWLESTGEPPPTGTAGSSAGTRSIGVYSPRATTQPIARGWA